MGLQYMGPQESLHGDASAMPLRNRSGSAMHDLRIAIPHPPSAPAEGRVPAGPSMRASSSTVQPSVGSSVLAYDSGSRQICCGLVQYAPAASLMRSFASPPRSGSSSEDLLGERVPQSKSRVRCEERLRRAWSSLSHWWKVTTNPEYLASNKYRLLPKLCVIWMNICAQAPKDFAKRDDNIWQVTNFYIGDLVVPFCVAAIPYQSIWLDILTGVVFFFYVAPCRHMNMRGIN